MVFRGPWKGRFIVMKSRSQKQEELKKGRELLDKSQVLIFTDFTKVSAEELRRLRRDLKDAGARLLVMKKRLLGLLLKERGIDFDTKKHKFSLGAVFSDGNLESVSGPIYKFFSSLAIPEGEKKGVWVKHILGGYNLAEKDSIDPERIVFIGKLPPREVLLAQLLGIIAAPIRSLMYLLDQKSKRSQ